MIRHNSKYKTRNNRKLIKHKKAHDRLKIMSVFFICISILIILRLINIQIWQHKWYEALASESHDFYEDLIPKRGEVYINDPYSEDGYHKIIVNQDLSIAYVNPWQVENKEQVIKDLYPLLNLTKEELENKLEPKMLSDNRKDTYEILQRKLSNYQKEAIEELNIKGIGFTSEDWRLYPSSDYTSHITGFLGVRDDEKIGQYGIEGYHNDELCGAKGYLLSEKDAGGRLITIGDKFLEQAKDGNDLYLTIDKNIQFYACDKLQQAVSDYDAKQGTVIIMEPQTGAIIASCSYPAYDPNNYSEVESVEVFLDDAVNDQYEPGSVFKSFSIGAALDMNKISPYTTYVDEGKVKIGEYTIKNSDGKAHGTQDMNFVLSESLNTGSIFAVQQIGNEAWYQYVAKLGFGERTGIELAGENYGNISSVEKIKDIYSATSSYGQGLTVTPIQLITAFNTIANNGKLMKPHIISKKVKPNGHEEIMQPEVVRQVYSAETARTLSAMLVNVIDSGHAALAGVDGYYLAGKTGTAQVAKESGTGYYETLHKDTFIGFGPIENPKFIMLTKLDEPKNAMWAASSAAPLFGDIAKYILNYYQIPPER